MSLAPSTSRFVLVSSQSSIPCNTVRPSPRNSWDIASHVRGCSGSAVSSLMLSAHSCCQLTRCSGSTDHSPLSLLSPHSSLSALLPSDLQTIDLQSILLPLVNIYEDTGRKHETLAPTPAATPAHVVRHDALAILFHEMLVHVFGRYEC